MPRIFENGFDIPLQWPQTALAVWHKYPNPFATHVVSIDVIGQTYDEHTGLLRVERILGVRQGAPGWAVKLLGVGDETYVREVTMIDAAKQSFEMTSTNLNLSNYLVCKEYITYLPRGRNLDATHSVFSQRAIIECVGFSTGLLAKAAKKLEDISFTRFGDNAGRGRQGLMHVCRQLWGHEDDVGGQDL